MGSRAVAKQKNKHPLGLWPSLDNTKNAEPAPSSPKSAVRQRADASHSPDKQATKHYNTQAHQAPLTVTVRGAVDGEIIFQTYRIAREQMLPQLKRALALAKGAKEGEACDGEGLQITILHQDKVIEKEDDFRDPEIELTALFRTQYQVGDTFLGFKHELPEGDTFIPKNSQWVIQPDMGDYMLDVWCPMHRLELQKDNPGTVQKVEIPIQPGGKQRAGICKYRCACPTAKPDNWVTNCSRVCVFTEGHEGMHACRNKEHLACSMEEEENPDSKIAPGRAHATIQP